MIITPKVQSISHQWLTCPPRVSTMARSQLTINRRKQINNEYIAPTSASVWKCISKNCKLDLVDIYGQPSGQPRFLIYSLGDWKDISIAHVIIIIKSEVSTFPIFYHIFPWLCAWDVCYIIFCYLLHIHSGKTGNLFSLSLCSLWWV